MRILFITSSRLEEAVTSCGILEQLRKNYPKARITVACGSRTAGLFIRLPRLDRVIIASRAEGKHFQRVRLWRKLIGKSWDIAVDMRGSNLTRFLRVAQRKIIRIRNAGQLYKQYGEAMGFSPAPLPVTWTNTAEHEQAKRLLGEGQMIGLGAAASSQRKTWPLEQFIETFNAIAKILPDARPVIFAGTSDKERQAVHALQASLPMAVCLPANLGMPELAACLSRLTLFIGNDTGLLHLAAAAAAPTIGLYGRDRGQNVPPGPKSLAVFANGPKSSTPMAALTVATVLEAATKLLQTP